MSINVVNGANRAFSLHFFKSNQCKRLFFATAALSLLALSFPSSALSNENSYVLKGIYVNDSQDLLNLLKQNKEEVLKKGQSQLIVDSKLLDIYKEDLQSHAVEIIDTLQDHGFEAYLVGGAVRDLLSGKNPKDFDVCTNASIDDILKLFKNAQKLGNNFPVVKVSFDDEDVAVSPFIEVVDKKTSKGQQALSSAHITPTKFAFTKSLAVDSNRRDLTINAIYFDINKSELIDFHGGLFDLKQHVINTIGDAATRYKDDPVRMLRVLRFAAKLNFTISESSAKPIRELGESLKTIHNMRLLGEVNKLFLYGHSIESYKLLKQYDLFKYLFPTLDAISASSQYKSYLENVVKDLDDDYANGIMPRSSVMFANMLWPVYWDEYEQIKKDVLLDPLLFEDMCQKVFQSQGQITALKKALKDEIKAIWKMQFLFLNNKGKEQIVAVAADPAFINGFELLNLRALSDKSLKKYVKFWQPYYEEKIALSY